MVFPNSTYAITKSCTSYATMKIHHLLFPASDGIICRRTPRPHRILIHFWRMVSLCLHMVFGISFIYNLLRCPKSTCSTYIDFSVRTIESVCNPDALIFFLNATTNRIVNLACNITCSFISCTDYNDSTSCRNHDCIICNTNYGSIIC